MHPEDYRLAAIMYSDIEGFGRMMEQEARNALDLLDYQHSLIRDLAETSKGRVIKTVGDDTLVEFPTTLDAVSCAVAIQETIADYNARSGKPPLRLRIGIHLGDIHFLENDALGEGINVASRLQSIARPGCVCVSEDVYNNVVNRFHGDFRRFGVVKAKNADKEINAYEIGTPSSPAQSGRPERGEPERESREPKASAGEDAEFDELKAFVVQQIKRLGRRLSVDRLKAIFPNPGPDFDREVERLADMGFLSRGGDASGEGEGAARSEGRPHDWYRGYERIAWEKAAWKAQRHALHHAEHVRRHLERHGYRGDPSAGAHWGRPATYAEYRTQVIEHAKRAQAGLLGNLIPFFAVNGFLFFINLTTGFAFPWFLFPLGGWSIGAVSHLVSAANHKRERDEVEALPETLSDKDYDELYRYHHARAAARTTAGSLLAVSVFLAVINAVVSPHYPWALFPIGGMMIAVVSTMSSYLAKRGGFLKRLKRLMSGTTKAAGERIEGEEGDEGLTKQARALAEAILAQARTLGDDKAHVVGDLKPLLDAYISQIRKLSRRSSEVDEIMAALPRAELERDLSVLRSRLGSAASEKLKSEYRRSIEQIERQKSSFDDLKGQKELLDLRIGSSINSLKQMQIDMARMAGLDSSADSGSYAGFRKKTEELAEYLQDLEAGYRELDEMPALGKRERLEADRLLQEFKTNEERRKKGGA